MSVSDTGTLPVSVSGNADTEAYPVAVKKNEMTYGLARVLWRHANAAAYAQNADRPMHTQPQYGER